MISSDFLTVIDVAICAAIALRLMVFSKTGRTHKRGISWIAAGLILFYGNFALLWLFGQYHASGWPVVVANGLICLAVFAARGNVSRLIPDPSRRKTGE
ncbi:phage holin family protein [Pantoea agglomerans pv. betae]|uniref:phage holin family protein n=1 Tax=Enterobacter agglomerans TaxID=549 RepID=UPI0007E54DAD|nr:phage holin family protein [Pantoea agglomerans]WHU82998.1 phage holin family protein [Pantoea agglomerans pv. betae]